MNFQHPYPRCGERALHWLVAGMLSFFAAAPQAAPGAHGPNGEHLDGGSTASASTGSPRVEAKSEQFELVALLYDTELSILIDRYETNEPVLGADLEVEAGGLKAKAKFHADHGDYAVDDAEFLKRLATPGEHALVFTLVAGKEADLLDGTLVVMKEGAAAADGSHGHDHALGRAGWIGAGITAVALLAGVGWWRQRRRETSLSAKGVRS